MSVSAVIPSVRSRLMASGTSFVLGFGLANYGLLMITRPDQWLWIAVAVVLMLTGAIGVLFADTGRSVSMWAILGVEVFFVLTLLPLLWAFTLATAPEGTTPQTVLPAEPSWGRFSDVLGSDLLQHAAATSALVAAIATVVSMVLALAAAYALVRLPVRARRVVYAFAVAVLLIPLVALTGPIADQLIAADGYDSRLTLVLPALLITLPLAIWLCVTVFRDAPWSLRDAVRADGATRLQTLRHFAAPRLGPGLVVATLLVFVAGCNDFVLGATLAGSDASRPLPASLLLSTGQLGDRTAVIVAAGLLWLAPAVVLLLVFPRRIIQLLGRSYR